MSGLRPYQTKLKHDIYGAWDSGAPNVLAVLPTGGGKTRTVADMIAEMQEPAAIIAHRQELVGQLSVALARERVRHGIVAPPSVVRDIVKLQIDEVGVSYFDPNAKTKVAGVDTLVRLSPSDPWLEQVRRWVQDEGHHVQEDNKWGKAASMFRNARGLAVTATPVRADKKGLGRGHGGIMDAMVEGPQMQELMDAPEPYLTGYDVACCPSDVDYSHVKVGSTGDLSSKGLREAVHKSNRIVGDVVEAYLKHAAGKRGITFAVDVEEATKLAERYKERGVPAAVIHGAMHDLERIKLMRQFRAGQLLQLCNCDILGEGVDVPAVEVVSMARKTLSYSLFAQQFGRMLRPFPGKSKGLLIDHVGNFVFHKPPNKRRIWTLEGAMKMARKKDEIPMRECPSCTQPYERFFPACPHCGFAIEPAGRSTPQQVEGDIALLSPDVIAAMCADTESVLRIPVGAAAPIIGHLHKVHRERQNAQRLLRDAISQWGGYATADGLDIRTAQRKFWHVFGVDVLTAQALGAREAAELERKVREDMGQ